jgi:hypothetical protein
MRHSSGLGAQSRAGMHFISISADVDKEASKEEGLAGRVFQLLGEVPSFELPLNSHLRLKAVFKAHDNVCARLISL